MVDVPAAVVFTRRPDAVNNNNNNNITITIITTSNTGPRRTTDVDDELVHSRTRGGHGIGARVVSVSHDDDLAGWDAMIFSTTHFTHLRTHTHSMRDADASEYWNLLVSSTRRYGARPTLTAATVIVYIGPHSCVQSERPVRLLRNSVWKRRFCFCVSADPIVLSAFFPTAQCTHRHRRRFRIHCPSAIVESLQFSFRLTLSIFPTTVSQTVFYVVIFRFALVLHCAILVFVSSTVNTSHA